MFYFPNAEVLYATGVVTSGTEQDEVYQQWLGTMREYSSSLNTYEPVYEFWMVVRMLGKTYSENLVDHPTLPMMMPASGTGSFIGFAKTKDELDEMITPEIDPKTGLAKKDDRRGEYVYLTYKVKMRGEEAWRGLLDYLGQNGMLEKDT